MRVIRLLMIAAVCSSALLAVAGPASAASTSKACKSLKTLETSLEDVSEASPDNLSELEDTYDDIGSAFHKAADQAPKKYQKSLDRLGDLYESVGDGDVTAFQRFGTKSYSKSFGKYLLFVSTSCS